MKSLFLAFALIPSFAFAGSIVLTINAEQGLSKLRHPGEVLFESTNFLCEERGLIPQPWSAPKKQKFAPRIISQSDKSLVIEISSAPKKQDFCKYKLTGYTLWSDDGLFFVSVDAANASNMSGLDAADLELTGNLNSLYKIECKEYRNLSKKCLTLKDGIKKGYSSGNGSRLYVDMPRLEIQKEIRPVVEFKRSKE